MARLSATAALLLAVLSLLAVAHCGALAADHDTEPESTAAVAVAVSDDNVLSDPTVHAEAGAASATDEEALPAEQQHGIEVLRLPSHRLHHHHHLWWKRHHGIYRDASRRFPCSGHGARREAVSHLATLPASAEAAREAGEVMPVAEPDPDRSLPDSDGEGEVATSEPSPFTDADGHDDVSAAAVRAWKKEMLRRWFRFHFHHGMRRHRLHHVQHEEEEEATPETTESMDTKRHRFHFHHHDEEDEEKNMVRKRLRHADEHDEDSDDEDDQQVEEMVRRFRKAIMRRRFGHGHGRSRFFHHVHWHAEEANKKQADVEEEESGVLAWIKGLMNRF